MNTKPQTIAQRIASLRVAIDNCARSGNTEWQHRHRATLEKIMRDTAPSGSGFDSGTQLNRDAKFDPNVLLFETEFHHMNDAGMYDGWTQHRVIVRPSFAGIEIRVTGRDRNEIKSYIADVFHDWLMSIYEE